MGYIMVPQLNLTWRRTCPSEKRSLWIFACFTWDSAFSFFWGHSGKKLCIKEYKVYQTTDLLCTPLAYTIYLFIYFNNGSTQKWHTGQIFLDDAACGFLSSEYTLETAALFHSVIFMLHSWHY